MLLQNQNPYGQAYVYCVHCTNIFIRIILKYFAEEKSMFMNYVHVYIIKY